MHSLLDRNLACGARTDTLLRPARAGASFREYVDARKYDFGRGSAAAWNFIALARGDRNLPDARSWRELEAYLQTAGLPEAQVAAARSVWRSFTAYRSRVRRQDPFL
ncbi:hypothetical protein [Sphingosinicella sp. CPCC 101087]|uniref:hypothetical protein n=1 Tax=Sphingosinicella sp. CPCC 101087 TaxID=2497754 RepID=UPI00101E051C|nr:hypothetical protein [Sphingosinicella sp. CPCC 101087]